ncbi:MAG: RIP metalloprotease RseP [Maritimibacter sp.]
MDLANLIPSFGNLALTVLAFILALIPIVTIHEFGHYIVGRWSGIRADVFSVGMGPTVFSRTDKHGTRWQIAAYPVGGYVKFHGDANAASANADDAALAGMDEAEKRTTLHGAPLWARAATVSAGPLANFVFSTLVFATMLFFAGIPTDPLTVDRVDTTIAGDLRSGDVVLAINGQPTPGLEGLFAYVDTLPDKSPLTWTVERDGQTVDVEALHPYPPLVSGVNARSAAIDAGLHLGDLIETVNGDPIASFGDLQEIVANGDGAALDLGINRSGERLNITLSPRRQDIPNADGSFETRWLIGIAGGLLFDPASRTPGLWDTLTGGADQVIYIIRASLTGLAQMIVGNISSCNMGGLISIAQTSGQAASQGAMSFVGFLAVLSTAIGLLNLFPIPVLDGGHLVFHAYEALAGKPPSERVLGWLMTIGLFVVLSAMLFGLMNDLMC